MPAASWLLNLGFAGSAVVATPTITTTELDDATVGEAYSQTLQATGGTDPFTWTITVGSLPDGLALDANTGVISGTPTTAETQTFTVQVEDANSSTDTQELSITVNAAVVDQDPQVFGVWRRVPLNLPLKASDVILTHERARARVEPRQTERIALRASDIVPVEAHGKAVAGLAKAIRVQAKDHAPIEPILEDLARYHIVTARCGTMRNTDIQDILTLASVGVIDMEVAMMLLAEELG